MNKNLKIKRLSIYQSEIGKRTKLIQKSISRLLEDGYGEAYADNLITECQEIIQVYKNISKCLLECEYDEEKSLKDIKNIINLINCDL